MKATLNPELFKQSIVEKVEGTTKRAQPDDILVVFDIEKAEWRSINLNRYIGIE